MWIFLSIHTSKPKVFSLSVFSSGGKSFSFLCTLLWSELNYIAICLCNMDPDLIFPLNQFFYWLLTAMRSVTKNHTMDLFCLLKDSFKHLPFDSLMTGRNFEILSHLSSCLLSQRSRFQTIRPNLLRGVESNLAYTKG